MKSESGIGLSVTNVQLSNREYAPSGGSWLCFYFVESSDTDRYSFYLINTTGGGLISNQFGSLYHTDKALCFKIS